MVSMSADQHNYLDYSSRENIDRDKWLGIAVRSSRDNVTSTSYCKVSEFMEACTIDSSSAATLSPRPGTDNGLFTSRLLFFLVSISLKQTILRGSWVSA